MTATVVIRELEPEDHQRIVEIGLAAWATPYIEEREFLGEERFGLIHPDWREEQAGYIQWGLKNAAIFLVAEQESSVVGFVTCNPDREMPGFAEIELLAVHPDYQRHGISQILLRESFRRAKEAGYEYGTVNVGVDPYDSAKRAYEKAGFVVLSMVKSLWSIAVKNHVL